MVSPWTQTSHLLSKAGRQQISMILGLSSLELELQVCMGGLTWYSGAEIRTLVLVIVQRGLLTTGASFQAPVFCFETCLPSQ